MVLKEELFEAVKTNKLKNRFDLLKNRRIEDDVTGHRPSVYDKKQIKEEPNEIQDDLYDRLESAIGKHLSVVPGSNNNSWEVTHKNKEVLKPVAKWLRQRGIPYNVSKLWNYYTINIPFDTIPADFDKRKKSTKEVELKGTVDNISTEDSLDLEEKLVNDEVKDFFKKADKLGIKTMGDLQKLFNKEMSRLKADGTEMSDAEAMDTYYQEANPENKELKNESANTLESLFKELADCEKEINGENLTEELSQEEQSQSGLTVLLNDLINDENEAINGYESAKVMFAEENKDEFIPVIESIIEDERNHIGNLQELLDRLDPGVQAELDKGQEEAIKILDNEDTEEVVIDVEQ